METENMKNAEDVVVESGPVGPSKNERQWATGCHLSALAGYAFPPAIVIAPLVLWLIKREDGAFIDEQGKEALNFQISILIYIFGSFILIPVLGLGAFLLVGVAIFDFVCIIMAAIKISEGSAFRYPACIRFIK
jgi:uncharacterized Tic20 family protein